MVSNKRVSGATFDWSRFWVRFAFGAPFGALFGFGFWVQMNRPENSPGFGKWVPRQVAEWLGFEAYVDSGIVGLAAVLIFAFSTGIIVGLWRCKSR